MAKAAHHPPTPTLTDEEWNSIQRKAKASPADGDVRKGAPSASSRRRQNRSMPSLLGRESSPLPLATSLGSVFGHDSPSAARIALRSTWSHPQARSRLC